MIVASALALVCLVLLLLRITGPGSWFLFAAMTLLALSHARTLIRERRERLRE